MRNELVGRMMAAYAVATDITQEMSSGSDLHKGIEAALQAVEDAGMLMQWQPIETAPKDGTLIDIWIGKERRTVRWCLSEDRPQREWWCEFDVVEVEPFTLGWRDQGQEFSVSPTHWMPLPAPPKEISDDK